MIPLYFGHCRRCPCSPSAPERAEVGAAIRAPAGGPGFRPYPNGLAAARWAATDRRSLMRPSAQKSFLRFCFHGPLYCIISRSAIAGRKPDRAPFPGKAIGALAAMPAVFTETLPPRPVPRHPRAGPVFFLPWTGTTPRLPDLGANPVHLFADAGRVVIRNPPGRGLPCHANCMGILFKANFAGTREPGAAFGTGSFSRRGGPRRRRVAG